MTKEGSAIYYYPSGKIKKTVFYSENNLSGSHIQFDLKGNIDLFICHDGVGDTVFLRSYDMNGKLKKEKGDILPLVKDVYDRLSEYREMTYVSFIVNAPHTSITVSNYCTYNNNLDTIYPFHEDIEYDWVHYYYFKIPKHGLYKYNQTTMLIDSTNRIGLRQRDTVVSEL